MTGLSQPFSELLDPAPHRNVGRLNAGLYKNPRDLSETYAGTVQGSPVRRSSDLSVRARKTQSCPALHLILEGSFGSALIGDELSHLFR